MKVGIITCMSCMFAVALTVGGPIRRQASQSEKTVPIGGNVTLLCTLFPNDLWKSVYWKKNDHTIYSLAVKSKTTTTNDTRYEGSNLASRLTIKDLKKTDSGIYHCKVVIIATTDFIKEGGQVMLSVTDQEVGQSSTTSPGVLFRATKMAPQPAEDNKIFLVFLIFIPIIFITGLLVFKYRERDNNLLAGFLSATNRLAPNSTSTPLPPDSSHREIRDEAPNSTSTPLPPDSSHREIRDEGTHNNLLGSDTHGRDDVDVDDNRPEESSMHPSH